MLKFEDLKYGEQFVNIKNQKTYTLSYISLHSEGDHEALANYKDSEGNRWTRPLGLFMVKFRKITDLEKVIRK